MQGQKKYKKVVLIDDDRDLIYLLKLQLKQKELLDCFIPFDNPRDALRYLKESDDAALCSYILIDLYMPGIDGFEILKQIDNIPKIKNSVEIYVCTNSSNEDDRKRAMKYSFVSSFFEKPLANNFLEFLITDGKI